ncbi:glycosyltransferase [Puia sp.]|uniref:glycosyltransferase n=1 Tax=Puia sp. TaxID=2045100 RepID=UPI002F428BB3
MKKILIISPHFPPSNLAAVHRSRLFAQHLPTFGWEPVILTVDEKYYEEALDPNLSRLLPEGLRIEKVKAFPVTRPRLIGDIGLRGLLFLYRRAKKLIREEGIDFLYIPIPSFYVALLGRWLHRSTGVRYGIDYIDPWVHEFPGSRKRFSRHWWSTRLARMLEPIAVRRASLITGVAEGYYKGVIERNPRLSSTAVFGAMPYGGEGKDHERVKELGLRPYLFTRKPGKLLLVYAGAMLPKAYAPLEAVLNVIKENPAVFSEVEFHFIGTGKTANDPNGHNIKPLAERYGLWGTTIFEYPARIPYLDVLIHLEAADGIFVLGSTEPHYTPSKVFQGILSHKPVMALLHEASTARKVVVDAGAGTVLAFNGEDYAEKIGEGFVRAFVGYSAFLKEYSFEKVNRQLFDEYSAYHVTEKLAALLGQAAGD